MRSATPLNPFLQGELMVLAVQLAFRGHLGPLEVIWGRAGPPRRSFCHLMSSQGHHLLMSMSSHVSPGRIRKLCARGGRGTVEDMCYRVRRVEACV
jgi:hypothetical protein